MSNVFEYLPYLKLTCSFLLINTFCQHSKIITELRSEYPFRVCSTIHVSIILVFKDLTDLTEEVV